MRDLTLQNGVKIPMMGLGTFRAAGDEAYTATLSAIKMGYRHIDTAMIYRNEEQVGQAIKDSGVAREELFITTKLWTTDLGYEEAKSAFALSLQKLGLDYLDLYLVHWPKAYERNAASWRALEELYTAKKIRAIGVCNFKIHHLEHLFQTATIKPMINQVECHVELQNIFLQEMCLDHGIHLQAYAPLLSKNVQDLLNNETLKTIAQKHEVTIAQVALAWLLERNIIVLPKSTNDGRLLENYQSLNVQLDEVDMATIRSLNKARRTFPDPDNTDF